MSDRTSTVLPAHSIETRSSKMAMKRETLTGYVAGALGAGGSPALVEVRGKVRGREVRKRLVVSAKPIAV